MTGSADQKPTAGSWTERGPIVLAVPAGSSPVWAQLIATWNTSHPNEPVTLRELPTDPLQRHDELTTAAKAGRGEFTVTALDDAWLPEFASNNWVAQLTADFPTDGMLPVAVAAASYQGARYGHPVAADAGVLYYRKDLLAAAGVKAPTTWDELKAACDKVGLRSNLQCYGQGLRSSESLTIAASEAIYAAGGEVLGADGKPALNTDAAVGGVNWLATAANKGTIPAAALNWQDDQVEQSFAQGQLVFARGWTTSWRAFQSSEESEVVGKVGLAQLPGKTGPSASVGTSLQLVVSANARNGATAADFMRWLTSAEIQRQLCAQGSYAPVLESLYTDAALIKQQPNLPTIAAAIKSAKVRPASVRYTELSKAMAEALYPVVQGKAEASKVLPDLQTRVTDLLK